jgi:hypothetical protein
MKEEENLQPLEHIHAGTNTYMQEPIVRCRLSIKTNNLANLRSHRNLDNRMKAISRGLHLDFSLEIKPEQE